MSMLVRLKPYDPRRGHVLRRYTVSLWDTRFEVQRGWYEVPDEWAAYLRTLRQNANDSYSKEAFDVCTRAEAERIDALEAAAADPKAGAAHPYQVGPKGARHVGSTLVETNDPFPNAGAITTADLPKMSSDAPVDDFSGAGEAGMSLQPAAPSPPPPVQPPAKTAPPARRRSP